MPLEQECMTLERIAAVQALVLGLISAWAGSWKLFSPEAPIAALKSALVKLLPQRKLTLAVHRLIGIGELVIGALLLVSPWYWFGMRLATVFTIGFITYLLMAWRVAPKRIVWLYGGPRDQDLAQVGRAGGIASWTHRHRVEGSGMLDGGGHRHAVARVADCNRITRNLLAVARNQPFDAVSGTTSAHQYYGVEA